MIGFACRVALSQLDVEFYLVATADCKGCPLVKACYQAKRQCNGHDKSSKV